MSFQRADGCQPTVIVQAIKERRLSNHCLEKVIEFIKWKRKTWAKRLWLENTVIKSFKLLSSIDGPIREPLHVRWSHTLIELAFQVANLRHLARTKPQILLSIIKILHNQQLSTTVNIRSHTHSQIIWEAFAVNVCKHTAPKDKYKERNLQGIKSTYPLLDSPPTDLNENCLLKDDCDHSPCYTVDHDRFNSLTGVNTRQNLNQWLTPSDQSNSSQ